MRPKSIAYFERIMFATLFVGAAKAYWDWHQLVAFAVAHGRNGNFVLTVQVFVFLVIGTLTLLVSRGRSRIAMWISIGMFVLGLPMYIKQLIDGQIFGSQAISLLQALAELAAFSLLFLPSARQWMARETAPFELNSDLSK